MSKNLNTRALIVSAGDWEGLYIDGKLVCEGHTLNEGHDRGLLFILLCDKYGLKFEDFQEAYFKGEYEIYLHENGSLPSYEKVIEMILFCEQTKVEEYGI